MAKPLDTTAANALLNQSQTNPTGDSQKPASKTSQNSIGAKLSSDVTEMLLGVGRGSIDTLGLPVDIVADTMRGMGVPVPEMPIGGSKYLRSKLGQPLTDSPEATIGSMVSPGGAVIKGTAAVKGTVLPLMAGIFARPDPSRWNAAETMKSLGASKEDVMQGTGVFPGLGGQPRREIPDTYAKLLPTMGSFLKGKTDSLSGLAPQILKHDRLYSDPDIGAHLGRLKVTINRTDQPGTSAVYDSGTHEVIIDAAKDANHRDIAGTLLHEMQHAVQVRSGMQLGGSPEALLEKINADKLIGSQKMMAEVLKQAGHSPEEVSNLLYWGMAGEVEAREVAKRYGMTLEQLRTTVPSFDVWPDHIPREGRTPNYQGREFFDKTNTTVPDWETKNVDEWLGR